MESIDLKRNVEIEGQIPPGLPLGSYLTRAKELDQIPNFWMSAEYFYYSGLTEIQKDGWVWMEDKGICMFPPLPCFQKKNLNEIPLPVDFVWADTETPSNGSSFLIGEEVELDYEFIYSPSSFLDMRGNKWKVFRKNSRRWPRENKRWKYVIYPINGNQKKLEHLVGEWADEVIGENTLIHDYTAFANHIVNSPNRGHLYDSIGELVGVNIWDENWLRLNYRYCISRKEPYLNEFLRLIFYVSCSMFCRSKLVNDGGALGRQSLYQFKKKLNPVSIRNVNSIKNPKYF